MELIEKIEKLLGDKIKYKILDIVRNEIPYQHLDDSKIRKLGWSNAYSIDKAFPQVLGWYKKFYRK